MHTAYTASHSAGRRVLRPTTIRSRWTSAMTARAIAPAMNRAALRMPGSISCAATTWRVISEFAAEATSTYGSRTTSRRSDARAGAAEFVGTVTTYSFGWTGRRSQPVAEVSGARTGYRCELGLAWLGSQVPSWTSNTESATSPCALAVHGRSRLRPRAPRRGRTPCPAPRRPSSACTAAAAPTPTSTGKPRTSSARSCWRLSRRGRSWWLDRSTIEAAAGSRYSDHHLDGCAVPSR